MIRNKKELDFYVKADRIMNGLTEKPNLKELVLRVIKPNPIIAYLYHMRCYSYYKHKNKVIGLWHFMRFRKLGMKCGFSIREDVFGYGLVIPHWGTIVISSDLTAGNFCVLHTSTCVGGVKS